MFCVALVLLLQCLFGSSGYTFKVGGPDFFQLDLFESLHLHNSTYQGVSLGLGINTISPGVIFTGDFRNMMMTGDWIDKIRAQLASVGATEFTISTIVKQNPNNVGTLLAFSKGLLSALEIQSSGRKNELRVISGSTVETFPYRLADGSWHRLALSFSASQVEIIIDCSLTYRRVLKFDPATAIFDSRNISIWIGQKTTSHFLYQGVMQDLRLTFGPYGYLSQCPQMDSQCPTCSDFTALKSSFATLQSKILELTERLTRAESRLSNVEECECQKSCRVNETTTLNDGTTWQVKCEICNCKSGEISCRPIECNPTNCKNPSTFPGECCPTCLKNCYYGGKNYEHGEIETRNCVDCECLNGSMQCKRRDPCPPLHCDPSEQIQVPGECCKICPGTDYCALHGSQCHSNATCVNLQTTFACQCHEGFTGDGFKSCEDQNECLLGRHHCGVNTECRNTQGGYICDCLPGFKKLNEFQCTDINECENSYEGCKSAVKSICEESKDEICEDDCDSKNLHKCHTHSTCTNIKGSYTCSCDQDYTGDGFHCSPICNRTCENGGLCIAPGLCSCRPGWTGAQCETDIDECSEVSRSQILTSSLSSENELDDQPAEDLNREKIGQNSSALVDEDFLELAGEEGTGSLADLCPLNSYCVNKPGWFYCQCRDGFQANLAQNGEAHCQDIDECLLDHPCSRGMTCTNTIGSFKCHCPDENNLLCSPGCVGEDGSSIHPVGSKWFNQECQVCTCATGSEISCSPPTQSISSNDQNDCPLFCLGQEAYNNKIDNNCCSKCVPPVASAIGLNISSITNLITPPQVRSTSTSTSAPISQQQQQQKRCRHQQYSEYEYNSGDIWHFNCQTCECLGGEVDCWPMDCPPTDCPNPVLAPGDCCRRCPVEEDGCSHTFRNLTSNAMHECHLLENTIESGAQITLPHKNCISCKCRDGELCCNYDYYCIANSPDHSLLTSRGI